MKIPSFGTIVTVLFLVYLCNLFYSIWIMVQPPRCTEEGLCLKSFLLRKPNLELHIFVSSRSNPHGSEVIYLNSYPIPNYDEPYERKIDVKLPKSTTKNGTLYAHVFLSNTKDAPVSGDLWSHFLSNHETVYTLVPMSVYKIPEYKVFQLLNNDENNQKRLENPVAHIKAVMPVSMMSEPLMLSQVHMPSDIYQYIRRYRQRQEYLPIFLHNYLQDRSYNVTNIDRKNPSVPVLLRYLPISYAELRILTQTQLAMGTMKQFGFKDKDIDEIKAIFDTNHYLLLVSILVAFVHLWDISQSLFPFACLL